MLYCLDTNIIIDFFKKDLLIKSNIEDSIKKQTSLCITIITLAELFKLAYNSQKQEESLTLIYDFIGRVDLIDFNIDACRLFGQKHAELAKLGKQTQQPDLMVASIVLAHNATLVTRNPKDFINIQDLKLLTW